MDPVFCGLSNKILLGATSSSIAFDGVALSPDQVVNLGKLDDESIVVIFEKRLGVEACSKNRFEVPMGLFLKKKKKLGHTKMNVKDQNETYIMLLDNLLKACVIQLREFGQVVNIGYDVTQHLLKQQKILIGRRLRTRSGARTSVPRLILTAFDELNDMLHIRLAGLNALHNLLTLDLLEVKDLVEFAF